MEREMLPSIKPLNGGEGCEKRGKYGKRIT
jgi:hypothetical protein